MEVRPLAAIGQRLALALFLLAVVIATVYLGRDGYVDEVTGEPITLLDAAYYASVTITTTGYGDITPVTPGARLATTLIVTPARVTFLLLLVGTTLEVLTERFRQAWRQDRWRRHMRDHYIVCGFGTKGRSAAQALIEHEVDRGDIVVVDTRQLAVETAAREGYAAVHGNAATRAVLEEAGIRRARRIVVCPDTDEAAVLVTLTARELNPDATIVAAVREVENARLLRQSGADSVITTAAASGRLLGMATHNARLAEVVEELLVTGQGLDIQERAVRDEDVGLRPGQAAGRGELVVAVNRDGRMLSFNDPACHTLQEGDRLLSLCSEDRRPDHAGDGDPAQLIDHSGPRQGDD